MVPYGKVSFRKSLIYYTAALMLMRDPEAVGQSFLLATYTDNEMELEHLHDVELMK